MSDKLFKNKLKVEDNEIFIPFYQKESDELQRGKISQANLYRNIDLIKAVSADTGYTEEKVLEELESYFNSVRYGMHNAPYLSIDLGFGRLRRSVKKMEKMTKGKYFTERFYEAIVRNTEAYYKHWESIIMNRKYNNGWTPRKTPKKVLKEKTYKGLNK